MRRLVFGYDPELFIFLCHSHSSSPQKEILVLPPSTIPTVLPVKILLGFLALVLQ
jgi:hypothetical protein